MFYIDNRSNNELGIIAKEEDFLIRAPIEYEEISVTGKDGSNFNEKKYLNVTGTVEIFILNKKNIDTILSYLSGKHDFIFNDRKTTIYFYDAIQITRYGTICSMIVSYIRSPFWISKSVNKTRGIEYIRNDGTIYSKPIIELSGDGNVKVMINNVAFEYQFDDDKTVFINCEEKEEKYNGKSKSRNIKIGFEYPILYPGKNKIKIEGNATMYFFRKDRWL